MAPTKGTVSFDAIIKRDREQRKNETLANQILGSGRRKSAPGPAALNKNKGAAAAGGSLASRMGVQKRSASAAPKPNINNTRWGHDLHHVNNPRIARAAKLPRTQSASRIERGGQPYQEAYNQPSNGSASNTKGASGISIRGMSRTGYTVVASNFAPGTTAADIEAVMAPVGGEMLYCKLTSAHPTVIAEMQFVDKNGADNVITMFNNRKADGRLLYVFMKEGGPSPAVPSRQNYQPPRPEAERDIMEVDDDSIDRRDMPRRTDVDYQDGRYGFRDTSNRDDYRRNDRYDDRRDRGMYSDDLIRQGRGYRR